MKKMTGLIMLMVLTFAWQGVAAAANWLFVQRLEGTRMGVCNEYVDEETVVRRGDRIVFWTMWLYEKPFGKQQVQQVLWKKEAILSDSGQVRGLEYYHYDQAGEEVFQYLKPTMFSPLAENYAARRAVQYARQDGGLLTEKPLDLKISPPRWYSTGADFKDFDLLVDVHSIKAVPKVAAAEVPAQFEMTVKRVWTEQAAAARRAQLMQSEASRHAYAGLEYMVTTYRFRSDADKMLVLLNSDHNRQGGADGFCDRNRLAADPAGFAGSAIPKNRSTLAARRNRVVKNKRTGSATLLSVVLPVLFVSSLFLLVQ